MKPVATASAAATAVPTALLLLTLLSILSPLAGYAAPTVPGACPALPTGDIVAGLATGQAVTLGSNVTLRFSSKVFGCADWSNDVSMDECFDWWSLRLTVPASSISPG